MTKLMTTEIASLPIYLMKQESHLHTFSNFIRSIEREGFYVKKNWEFDSANFSR